MPVTETHSFQQRSLSKLATNVAGAAIGLASQAVIPRALGPANYGDFSFITSFFWQAVALLNFNSSTAFYTKLSQRPGDRGLVRFFIGVVGGITVILALFVTAVWLSGRAGRLWPEQTLVVVGAGAGWAMLSFFGMVLSDMSDALGLTVYSERVKLAVKAVGFCALLLMFQAGWLSLGGYFTQQIALLTLTAATLASVIRRRSPPAEAPAPASVYAREFRSFCQPLVLFTVFSIMEQMLDRWLIQRVSGSRSQGYFALSNQIGAFCFLFTSSVVPLLFRENAVAYGAGDFNRLRSIFSRSVRVLFGLSAVVCVFAATQAKALVLLFGGHAFQGAYFSFVPMALMPVHQTLGQLNANLFFASERVRLYRNIGWATLIAGLPVSLFLIGPERWGGLEMGAVGLAIKMVLIQVVGVNVQLYFHARFLNVSFVSFLKMQGVVLSVLFGLALAVEWVARGVSSQTSVRLVVAAFLYGGAVLGLIRTRPALFSLDANDLNLLWTYLRGRRGQGAHG